MSQNFDQTQSSSSQTNNNLNPFIENSGRQKRKSHQIALERLNQYVGSSDEELFDDSEMENETEINLRHRSPRKAKKSNLRQPSVSSEEFHGEDDPIEILSSSNSDTDDQAESNCVFIDDWEVEDLEKRLDKLTLENKAFSQTSFGSRICTQTWNSLYEYQREGLAWLYKLYNEGVGGILADEMGLGKTAQICSHYSSLGIMSCDIFNKPLQDCYLVVCPATVLNHWLNEFHRWAPFIRTCILHSLSPTGGAISKLHLSDALQVLKSMRKSKASKGIVIITTYEGLRKNREFLGNVEWGSVCLDEGQKIKNHNSEITLVCKSLAAFHRIIISGTPIQNNLKEFWTIFDFVYPGRLGALSVFELEYAHPIRLGGYAKVSKLHYEVAIRCAATLQNIVKPYLLRRKKDNLPSLPKLPEKTERILFCRITDRQKEIYQLIINSDEVKNVLKNKYPAFRAITTLRKLCNHPSLAYDGNKILWAEDKLIKNSTERKLLGSTWADSGKMLVLNKILPQWFKEGQKVLIFCQTISILELIEEMISSMGFIYFRMDGTTPVGKRAKMIDDFNSKKEIFIMLLTTRTGGLGISLTAANRVVLFDPDWNPMTDIQARERAWRIGQQREVDIYRLISRGTIEEKIYQRQIFKLLLSNRILENPKQKALFTKSQMHELFELNLPDEFTVDFEESSDGLCLPSDAKVDINEGIENDDELITGLVPRRSSFPSKSSNSHPQTQVNLENSQTNDDKEAENEDKQDFKILKALFDGDIISSVYNHNYFEPGGREKKTHVGAQADRIADEAYRSLRASAPSFVPSEPDPSLPFGQRLSSQSSNSGFNSSVLFARFREQNQDTSSQTSSSNPFEGNIRNQSSIQPIANSSSSSKNMSPPETVGSVIKNNIIKRIRDLFRSQNTNALSTDKILNHFKDLGDQYAPIFRDTLRELAKLDGKLWRLKGT